MAKTKTISVTFRCPENLYNNLSNFALDNNIVKDGKPIISEALIAALVIGLGADSNTNVSQVVRQPNNIDFESIVNNAIAPLLARIESLEAISNEAKALAINTSEIVDGIELETLPVDDAIATDTAAPSIEKSLPDEVLGEAISATDISKPLPIIDAIASNKILRRSEALAIAQNFGFLGTGQNLYDWADAALNNAKSDETKRLNREKLASVRLAPVTRDDGKIGWIAISVTV